jgi:hypothetical protein
MINQLKNITISVSDPTRFKSVQLTLNWDASLEDWIDTFKTILIHQSFTEDTVKELFMDKDEYFMDNQIDID